MKNIKFRQMARILLAIVVSSASLGNSVAPANAVTLRITSFSPSVGYFGGTMTMTGENFQNATYIPIYYFSPTYGQYNIEQADFVSRTATSITFVLPAKNVFSADGTPGNLTAVSGASFYIQASNRGTDSYVPNSLVIQDYAPPVILAPTNNSQIVGTVGTAFNYNLSLTGTAPFNVTASGALPPGLSMTSSGVISGTPTVAGTTTLNFSVQDALLSPAVSVTAVRFVIASAPQALISTPAPEPPQQSRITGITPTTAIAGNAVSVVAAGTFVEKVSAIQVNGQSLPSGSWVQTASTLTFLVSPTTSGAFSVQIYNGSVPLLASQTLAVSPAPVLIATAPVKRVQNTYIRCVSGWQKRIAFGANPMCPSGYVKQ